MVALLGLGVVKCAYRAFGTTNINLTRFQSRLPVELVSVGRFLEKKDTELYKPGQLFLHKVFAYRGIIICAFNCKVINKPKPQEAIGTTETMPFYQVLIHKDDWDHMGFAYDMTSYFEQGGSNRQERALNFIHGMDCVPHNEIMPYCMPEDPEEDEMPPIKHDLFERFFEPSTDDTKELDYKLRIELVPLNLAPQGFWLVPQAVYRDVTENVEVQVTTYYMGINSMKGQNMHYWRYVTRVRNMDPKKAVILRSRVLKVYSLSNFSDMSGSHLNGEQPALTPKRPVYQFSSHVYLQQAKGGHMWGKLKMEREDGQVFEVNIPTVQLDSVTDLATDSVENSLV